MFQPPQRGGGVLFSAALGYNGLARRDARHTRDLFYGEYILKKAFALLAALLLLLPLMAPAETSAGMTPREDFINRMIESARLEFEKARGRAMPASRSGDIYVCKNFTVFMFRENRMDFRMAEFPDTKLVIADNLPKKESKPYVYGVAWKDIPAEDGNPFVAAHVFRYDTKLSKEENRALAREFLKQVQRGDFFQMAASYYYGVGAHSLVFTRDYDPQTDSVTWTDSNMKGKKVNGVRHGYIQFDEVKEIDWFVDAFCRKGYGATIYRLRDDIIYAP